MAAITVHPVDWSGLAATASSERFLQRLLDPSKDMTQCSASLIRTPPGGGSSEGTHVHDFEQLFYLFEGTMTIEVDGATSMVEAGSLIVFPQGVLHRNWNDGSNPTLHLSIGAPKS